MSLHLFYIIFCFFAASFLKGASGIGFATSCIAMLSLVFSPKYSIPLTLLPSIASNLMVMIQAGHFGETLKRFWLYFITTIPGIFVGVYLLTMIDQQTARTTLGVVLVLYTVFTFFRSSKAISYPCGESGVCKAVTGFLTGTINGLTGSQVLPVLPWLLSLKMDKEIIVQAMNTSFTMANIIMFALFRKIGFLEKEQILYSLLGVFIVISGTFLGGKIRKRVHEELFRKLIQLLLFILGIMLISAAF